MSRSTISKIVNHCIWLYATRGSEKVYTSPMLFWAGLFYSVIYYTAANLSVNISYTVVRPSLLISHLLPW